MNKDKWTQQLHDKLAGHEVAPPDDLWADIEAALPSTSDSKRPRALFVPMRRWAVAASLALLVAGGGYFWWQAGPEEPALNPQPELSQNHGDRHNDSSATKIGTSVPVILPIPVIHPSAPVLAQVSKPTKEESEKEVIEDVSEELPVSSNPEVTDHQTPTKPVVETDIEEAIRQMDEEIAMLSSKSHKDISINLYASNGLSDMQKANGVRMDEAMAARYEYEQYLPQNRAFARSDEPIYLYGYEERQKHYQPIAFGLSVNYPLTSKLSLSTGVIYTRLRSDFTSIINTTSISQEQTLYYLGVPLNAQYRLFHRGGLNVYLSGGAEADYNIKARLVSEGVTQHIDRDHWQFSVQGGVGIQYDILPQLGFYAEPGVKHYFDNGSRLRNFFKDKPTNFNLQVGLRLNITK